MEQDHHNPTPRDRFHAKWTVIAALLGALAGAGTQYLSSRDVTDAKLLEMRGEMEKERSRADRLEAQLQDLLGRAETKIDHQRDSVSAKETIGEVHPPISVDAESHGGSGSTPATAGTGSVEPILRQPFETESYRLTAEEVEKSGKTVRVTMTLEAIDEGGVTFRAGDWYLLDENGEIWSELKPDPGSVRKERAAGIRTLFRSTVRLVSGTKAKGTLVFNATGAGQGGNFTLIGVEGDPQPRREIVIRGLADHNG